MVQLSGAMKLTPSPVACTPGVGAAGRVRHRAAAEEALQHPLELHLDRAAGRLALPPHEAGAVEVQRGEEGPAHRAGI